MELNREEIYGVLDAVSKEAPTRVSDPQGVAVVQMTCTLLKLYIDEAMGDKATKFIHEVAKEYHARDTGYGPLQ